MFLDPTKRLLKSSVKQNSGFLMMTFFLMTDDLFIQNGGFHDDFRYHVGVTVR